MSCAVSSESQHLKDLLTLLDTAQKRDRPVLMGTASIADSEYFADLLTRW
jgi:preprotein translocase subunit SecA